MTKVILGNHTATYARHSDRDQIRKFYCDVLGCKPEASDEAIDHFRLDDIDFCFVYQETALDSDAFMRAIYLELKTDNVFEMKNKILEFGVRTLDVPGAGQIYFQAPGGQVFRLVGLDQDLSATKAERA